jgi:hypothetical protein
MKALHAASGVLPRVVAASYNYRFFPTTRGWAEMMRLGDLPEYAQGTGTDVEQFQSYRDAARQLLAGELTAQRTPFQTSQWLAHVAKRILANVDAARDSSARLQGAAAREFQTTTTDLKILAYLAQYHAARMKAAVWYNVYRQTRDRFALDRCVSGESQAIGQWKKIIESAGDVYPETLKFGVHRVGFSWHWKEELAKLEAGLAKLRNLPREESLDDELRQRILREEAKTTAASSLSITVDRVASATPGTDLTVTAMAQSESALQWVRLRYRHLTQFEDYETLQMNYDPKTGKFVGTIPGAFIVPEWDLMYFVQAVANNGTGRMAPDLEQEMPYVIVPVQRSAGRRTQR